MDVKSMLKEYGIVNVKNVYMNLSVPELYEHAVRQGEGKIVDGGPLVSYTGVHTGRSPNDKFVVREPSTEGDIDWTKHNKDISPEKFDRLFAKVAAYVQGKDLFVQECYAGANPDCRLKVRVITEYAWHNIFAKNMFIAEPDKAKLADFQADFTVIDVAGLSAIPELDSTNSGTFVLVNFAKKMVVIGGTSYAGEIKKSVFTVMNYVLPKKGIMSMHCSANIGKEGDTALFFGLSGTGKTTLSADPERFLIGDDEHGWDDNGVFNIEGGCYAKVINLSSEAEPDIFACTKRFGTILENVPLFEGTRNIDLFNDSITENTRASYPLTHLPMISKDNRGGHPKSVIFLTYDAFGVLPPVAKLSAEQAMFHFVSGYTAKVAGTEKGVKEPQATFSTCFGGPFMVFPPFVYAKILAEKLKKHGANAYLVNTGLTGGPYGIGKRYSIKNTRAIINAILKGEVDKGGFKADPIFGFGIPKEIPGVPSEILDPMKGWASEGDYQAKLKELASKFVENFKQYGNAPEVLEIAKGGPKL
ncbi:MAG: phosphoenolpyruvate carboxykinase (ATP) [Deferribacteraceae bacterium]|jgi:phosphoenolpyruvate carboxykinase (ATP)|nr:phosphoenolpyruvate carboxykinase (ATP) [Deferribacteraceae bacterium]